MPETAVAELSAKYFAVVADRSALKWRSFPKKRPDHLRASLLTAEGDHLKQFERTFAINVGTGCLGTTSSIQALAMAEK